MDGKKQKGKQTSSDSEENAKRRRKRETGPGQTNQPFERDLKRRIGQYGGAGEPALMKK